MSTPTGAVDFQAITQKQQAVWAAGDFHVVGRQVLQVSEDLVRAADPPAGANVLDVACGSGNAFNSRSIASRQIQTHQPAIAQGSDSHGS